MRNRLGVHLCIALSVLATGAFGGATALFSAGMPPPQAAVDTAFSTDVEGQAATLRAAMREARAGDWAAADAAIVAGVASPEAKALAAKLVRWLRYRERGSDAAIADILAFLTANPDWPDRALLLRNAEERIDNGISDTVVLGLFANDRPATPRGTLALVRALDRSGRNDRATDLLRQAWIDFDLGTTEVRDILSRYGKRLRREDHEARLDRLLWDGRSVPALQQAKLLGAGHKALAEARLMLMRQRGGVDSALARVPEELRNDAGLTYERLRWRRRAGFSESARELLDKRPATLGRPDGWWRERLILARRALADGDVTVAYRLARDHWQMSGLGLAECEWLAGWIALRFLQDHDVALTHFSKLYHGVNYPVSLARGAYWAGRAAAAGGKADAAAKWYALAARHATTYYGQLAAVERGEATPPPPEPVLTISEKDAFAAQELPRAAALLQSADEGRLAERFLGALASAATTPKDWAAAAGLAVGIGRKDIGVEIAKLAIRDEIVLAEAGYPMLDGADGLAFDPALVHAVIRQESTFDVAARSPAGARGLMQLMPATAQEVARKLRVSHSTARLMDDPRHNVQLGTAYLAQLFENYGGSTVLALAAYNAGPGRASSWIRDLVDPRAMGHAEVIDWIESIPIPETRNYVQRVLENATVYAARLDGRYDPTLLQEALRRTEVALTP